MNPTERIIIKRVIGNLIGSTKTEWQNGDVNQWVKFAKDERNMIMSSVSILEGLCDAPDMVEEKKSTKKEDDILGG
jgi:hypothetical protein